MVNLGCGMKCLKYLLFAFNFIFWVAGIAVLALGIWSRIEAKDWALPQSKIPQLMEEKI